MEGQDEMNASRSSGWIGRGRTAVALVLALGLAQGCSDTESTRLADSETSADAEGFGDAEGGETPLAPSAPVVPVPAPKTPRDVVVLDVKDVGEIRFELLPELAPETVANFTKLAREDAYDGTTFHRVIPGFMVQGGDPNSRNENPDDDGMGGPGYTIDDEFGEVSFVRGIVAMANAGRPKTAGSQFFIVHEDARHLDGKYTAFGRIVGGIDKVDAITRMPIDTVGRHGPRDRPRDDIVIADVRIEAASGPMPTPEKEASPAAAAAAPADRPKKEWDEG